METVAAACQGLSLVLVKCPYMFHSMPRVLQSMYSFGLAAAFESGSLGAAPDTDAHSYVSIVCEGLTKALDFRGNMAAYRM